jgi:hypothetical protein
MSDWEKLNSDLEFINEAISRTEDRRLAWSITIARDLQQLEEWRDAIQVKLRGFAHKHNVVPFVPRQKLAAAG